MSDIAPQIPSEWQLRHAHATIEAIRLDLQGDSQLAIDEQVIVDALQVTSATDPRNLVRSAVDALAWIILRKNEAEELRRDAVERRDRYAAREEWLRGQIIDLMQALSMSICRAPMGVASVAHGGRDSVIVPDLEALENAHPEYVKVTITKEARKAEIHQDIKAGKAVVGAYVSNSGPVLQLRKP